MTILVIGGTGLIGSQVVQALVESGRSVRAASRRHVSFPAGVEGAIVDLSDAATLRSALVGVEAVFAYSEADMSQTLVDELIRAGVKRLVLLSSAAAADNDSDDFNSQRHRASELVVERSSLEWTFLRPVAFASNTLFWKEQIRFGSRVKAAFPNASQSLVDPRDIASIAASAFASAALIGKAPILTGPESLPQWRQVEILAEVLGRDIAFEAITPDAARLLLEPYVAPEFIEVKLTALAKAEAQPDPVTDSIRSITGRAPRTFRDWALANVSAFR